MTLDEAVRHVRANGGGVVQLPAGEVFDDTEVEFTLDGSGGVTIRGAAPQANRIVMTRWREEEA